MGEIIVFFGGDSQVGTSMTAFAAAECLKNRGGSILFMDSSGNIGGRYFRGNGASIDDIKANINSGKVMKDDVKQIIEDVNGIDVIPGTRNMYTSKYYPENTVDTVIQHIKDQYRYILIDGGENANLGISVSALAIADRRFFVATQQPKSVERLMSLHENVLVPLGFDGDLIVNKYICNPAFYLKSEMASVWGKEDVMTVPYMEYGWQAEIDMKTLTSYGKYRQAIEKIADEITGVKENERRREGVLPGRLFGKKQK